MTNNVGLTFSVGETILRFTITIEQDKLELVTLNIIFTIAVGFARSFPPSPFKEKSNHLQ